MGRYLIAIALSIVVAAALAFGALRLVGNREGELCSACARSVHAHSRSVALVNGKRQAYCCPACALSEKQQSKSPVELIELTDHNTGATLNPTSAYLVRDSDVNECLRHEPTLSDNKQPMHSHYDRCAPSIVAFRTSAAAQSFVQEHGGQIVRFPEVAAQLQR